MASSDHDFVAANKAYFDSQASRHDQDGRNSLNMGKRLAKAIFDIFPFDEETTTVLDFACGPGLMSRLLASKAKSIVGVDISQKMVDRFNERADQQGLEPEEMRAVCVELTGRDDELEGRKFDVVVCCLAYHHFPSIEKMTAILRFFVKPGGSILVADYEAQEEVGPGGAYADIVPHPSGFSPLTMREIFEKAELTDVAVEIVTKAKLHGRDVSVFLAKGTKL
ncbi:S-adenosyl-L-methionine-dependent methyltransferase [Mycena floridula]|nr:S-adenosyl-L-methionine-dependent methyltransferase [Mycena floridula]